MKQRFITLSPECRNIELVKDVGQVPYVLGKEHSDIESGIVESCVSHSGENLEYVNGLNLIHKRLLLNNLSLTGAVYILFNAKNIDWLSLHHAGRRSYYWTKLYKFLNPKGRVYLKLDMDFRSCNKFDNNEWERNIFKKNTDVIDLITVETQNVKDRIQKYSSKDIKIIGNGYCKSTIEPNIVQKRYNTFITVGRLGTKQKATEVLLEAFAMSASQHDWILKLVGNVEKEFEEYIKDYFKKNPDLKNRVIFLGEIKNREELYDEYCKARVFVMSSRWESFCLAGCEALVCGCRTIVSEQMPTMNELTNNKLFGEIVPADDVGALSHAMINETKRQFDLNEVRDIHDYAEEQFSWSKICNQLYKQMMECQ